MFVLNHPKNAMKLVLYVLYRIKQDKNALQVVTLIIISIAMFLAVLIQIESM